MVKYLSLPVYIIIIVLLTKHIAETQEIISGHPAPEFNRHRVVQPTVQHGRTKREITSTRHEDGIHHLEVTVRVDIDGEELVLDLRLNEELVAGDHVIRYQKNGDTVLYKPKKEELDICQYSGTIRGKKGSWVAVSTCHGLRGVIYDGKQMLYIEPSPGSNIVSKHYVYAHTDLNTEFNCGYVADVNNNTKYDSEFLEEHLDKNGERSRSRYKRETNEDTVVRGPFNAIKLSRYVELVLVADHREYIANGESIDTVHSQLKDVANIINSVYAPLNIFIALVGVVVWTERDEIVLEEDGNKTLENFIYYRRTRLLQDIPNDNAHLLTHQKFLKNVVGKAYKKEICTYQFSGGVATNHSNVIGLVATTIAHEMGHNFGMEHDTEVDCECPDQECIMSPSCTSFVPVHWSSCSLRSLALMYKKGVDYCLRNKPKRLFDSPTCGNGFVEPGEQCDCGPQGSPACLACCSRACLLRSNATCAVGKCCDLETCHLKSAGTVCRSADKECDLPEFCTGYSEFCPRDLFKMDSSPCSNNQAYCVQGSCRTHTDQCRLLWGSTAYNSDHRCYTRFNLKGNRNGNCGQRRGMSPLYNPCEPEHTLCGLLHCWHQQPTNKEVKFGMRSARQLATLTTNGKKIDCWSATVDLGLSDPDPGMVPDGAKCGENKMCLKQRCEPIEKIVDQISNIEGSVCPSNCSGHGVCNSLGHCHCEPGFASPLCDSPGPGGSVDSGPTTEPSSQRNFMVAMYVVFLGILPTILLALFLWHYMKHNELICLKEQRKPYVSSICGKYSFGSYKKSCINFPFLKLLYLKQRVAQNSNNNIENNVEELESDNKCKKLKSQSNLVIINTGLAFTTNQNINEAELNRYAIKSNNKLNVSQNNKSNVEGKTNESINNLASTELHKIILNQCDKTKGTDKNMDANTYLNAKENDNTRKHRKPEAPMKNIKRKINKNDITFGMNSMEINHTKHLDKLTRTDNKSTSKCKEIASQSSLDTINTDLAFTTNQNITEAELNRYSIDSKNKFSLSQNDKSKVEGKRKVSANKLTSTELHKVILNEHATIKNNIKGNDKNLDTNTNKKENVNTNRQIKKVNKLIDMFEKK